MWDPLKSFARHHFLTTPTAPTFHVNNSSIHQINASLDLDLKVISNNPQDRTPIHLIATESTQSITIESTQASISEDSTQTTVSDDDPSFLNTVHSAHEGKLDPKIGTNISGTNGTKKGTHTGTKTSADELPRHKKLLQQSVKKSFA